jgi:DNA-binding CsgD family transcriptional regulator
MIPTGPYLRAGTRTVPLSAEITTVGRGQGCDVQLPDESVSVLHAELVRRGPYVYVADLGLSASGTFVNGRPVTRRLLADGDVVCFGRACCTAGGIPAEGISEPARQPVPDLTRRELDVLAELCRPALSSAAFAQPASVSDIARALTVSEAAVKQHLLRLFVKFGIPEGTDRRARLGSRVVALGLIRPGAPIAAARPHAVPHVSASATDSE